MVDQQLAQNKFDNYLKGLVSGAVNDTALIARMKSLKKYLLYGAIVALVLLVLLIIMTVAVKGTAVAVFGALFGVSVVGELVILALYSLKNARLVKDYSQLLLPHLDEIYKTYFDDFKDEKHKLNFAEIYFDQT